MCFENRFCCWGMVFHWFLFFGVAFDFLLFFFFWPPYFFFLLFHVPHKHYTKAAAGDINYQITIQCFFETFVLWFFGKQQTQNVSKQIYGPANSYPVKLLFFWGQNFSNLGIFKTRVRSSDVKKNFFFFFTLKKKEFKKKWSEKKKVSQFYCASWNPTVTVSIIIQGVT